MLLWATIYFFIQAETFLMLKGALKIINNYKPGYMVIPMLFTILEILNSKLCYCFKKEKEILVEKSSELLKMSAWNSGEIYDWRYKFRSYFYSVEKLGTFR